MPFASDSRAVRVSGEAVTNTRSTSRPVRANEAACETITTDPRSAMDARTCLISVRRSASAGRPRPPALGVRERALDSSTCPSTRSISDLRRSTLATKPGASSAHSLACSITSSSTKRYPSRSATDRATASPPAPVECEMQTAETMPRSYVLRSAPRPLGRRLPQVGIGPVEPVLPRRTEDVDVERLLECLGLVRQAGRDVQHLAGADVDDLGPVLAEPEAQHALQDVRELLVVVRMHGDDRALVEVDVGQHHALGADEPPRNARLELGFRHVLPAVERRLAIHFPPPDDADYVKRLMNARAVSATSRQPLSMVSAW